MLTARVGSEATLEAFGAGADDFIGKPFHPQHLLARIETQLRLRAAERRLAAWQQEAATLMTGVNELLEALDQAAQGLEGRAPSAELAEIKRLIAAAAAQTEGATERLGA